MAARPKTFLVVSAVAAILCLAVPVAGAAPPPNPLPWQRQYVAELPQTPGEIGFEILGACFGSIEHGVIQNASSGPTIAVIGDSVAAQWRSKALPDTAYHWAFAALCGERFGTALDSGRAGDAMATNPNVLLFDIGYNTFLDGFQNLTPSLVAPGLADLQRLLDATDAMPCRVILNLPRVADPNDTPENAALRLTLIDQVNAAFDQAAATRPNLHVADWSARVAADPYHYLTDGRHLLNPGTNAKINLAIEAGRQCLVPDTPVNLTAVPGPGRATISWTALPDPEKVTQYRITASDGRSIVTSSTSKVFNGLADNTSYQFKVSAINGAGEGEVSGWSAPITPLPSGSVAGTVRDKRGPLPNMIALVIPSDQLVLSGFAVTAADGSFNVGSLPPGQYKVAVADLAQSSGGPNFYNPEFYDNGGNTAAAFPTATIIDVTAGGTTALNPIELDYNHPGSITGTITDGNAPLAGMLTIVAPAGELRAVAIAGSGADGTFTIPNLPPGAYKLVTVDPAYLAGNPSYFLPEFYDNGGSTAAAFATATTITVNPAVATALNPVALSHTP